MWVCTSATDCWGQRGDFEASAQLLLVRYPTGALGVAVQDLGADERHLANLALEASRAPESACG